MAIQAWYERLQAWKERTEERLRKKWWLWPLLLVVELLWHRFYGTINELLDANGGMIVKALKSAVTYLPPNPIMFFVIGGLLIFISLTVHAYFETRPFFIEAKRAEIGNKKHLPLKGKEDSSASATTPGMRALIPGVLDLDSILFHEVANEINKIRATRDKIIPTKYLFAHAESYKFYRALRKSPEYTMAAEGDLLFSDQSGAIANALVEQMQGHRTLTIVTLGIGIGRKEGALLQKLCAKNISVSVLTVDINPAFIYASLREDDLRTLIDYHRLDYKIVIGDFERLDELAPLLPTDSPVLYLTLGGVFGNQNESGLLESIKRIPHAQAYLLMDFQTTSSFETINRGGYDSEPNKLFIQKVIQVFCHEKVKTENIHAEYYDDLRQLHRERPTAVPNAKTIVMVGKTDAGAEMYVGYSTRYDKKSLRKFLDERGCEVVQEFNYPRHPHTLVFLCKLGEALPGPASRLREAAKGART